MKTTGLLLLLALIASPLEAQWKWVNPIPQGDALYDVCTLPGGRIWVTGGSGTLLAWDPSPGSWRSIHTMIERTLLGIQGIIFTDSAKGFLLSNGTLMGTIDGGRSWNSLPGASFTIRRISRAPGDALWISGGTGGLARWNGGGWDSVAAPIGGDLNISFISGSELFAAGPGGMIAHSTDAGSTWSTTQHGAGDVRSLSFGSGRNGLAVQATRTLIRTTDGGATWKDTTLPVNAMTQVLMADSLRGWLVANTAGILYRTPDAGRTWHADTVDPTFSCTFQAVSCPNPSDAVVIGNHGEIYRTTDFGTSWRLLGSALTRNLLWSLSKSAEGAIFAFGESCFLRSTDDGAGWRIFPFPGIARSGVALSQANLVAAGDSNIYTSADSGKSWHASSFAGGAYFYDLSFANASVGWAVGQPGLILRTTDGGATWSPQTQAPSLVLHGAAAVSPSECWAVGHSGLVLHTTDGGGSWNKQTIGAPFNFRAVRFLDRQTGWIGGEQMLYRTTDGGITWDDLSSRVGPDVITAIDAADPGGLACLKPSSVMRSVDGGSFIYREDYPSYGMTDLLLLPGEKALAVGDNGTILKYEPAPYLSVAPSPLLFGGVEIGKSAAADLILSNRGETDLAIDSAMLVAKGFSLETPLRQVLIGRRNFLQARISFTPTDLKPYAATLTIWSSDLPGVQRIEMRGEGIAPVLPVLQATPNPVPFGIVKMNTYAPMKVAITNTGRDALLINSETITGTDSTSFYILKESGYFLAKGATDTISLVFRPLATGSLTAFLTIASSDPNMPLQQIPLSGTGIAPLVSASAQSIDFGPVLINAPSERSLLLFNTGSADAAISGVSIGGADKALFSLVRQLPPTLPAKHLDSLIVSFLPTTIGERQATLRIDSDDPLNPSLAIDLRGKGVTSLAVRGEGDIARTLELLPGYPNPFGPGSASGIRASTIQYRLGERARVTLEVSSLLGERVALLADEIGDAGLHSREWRPGNIPGGHYFIRISATAGGRTKSDLRVATYIR